ncbi:MAG: glycosyltransferase family 2 protein [Syntrophobacteraceae bacterium]
MQKVSIVIPFYNGDEFIDTCLKSLSLGSCAKADKIIVNNSDKPTEIHNIAASYENITVIDAKPRIGFGRACNDGAKICVDRGAQYIIFLNQDSIVHEDLLVELIKPLEESDDLIVTAPIHYDYNFSSIERGFIAGYLTRCPALFYDALNHQLRNRYKIDCISGACFAIRSEFINRYGLFDPVYFMYWEDDDLCRKIRHLKYDIALVPGAKIAHRNHVGESYNDMKKVEMWMRHSKFIYDLKDINILFLKTCIYVCYYSINDYLRYCTAFRFDKILHALITDIRLVINLPRIMLSRNVERNFVRIRVM